MDVRLDADYSALSELLKTDTLPQSIPVPRPFVNHLYSGVWTFMVRSPDGAMKLKTQQIAVSPSKFCIDLSMIQR